MNIREYLNNNPAIIDFAFIEWLDDDLLAVQIKTYRHAIHLVSHLEALHYQLEKWQDYGDYVEMVFERLYEGRKKWNLMQYLFT